MSKIIITIEDGGATEIKVEGCAGPSCANLTAAIEKALGSTVADVKTPDYHRAAGQENKATTGAK